MSFQTPFLIKDVIEKIDKREFLLPAIQREFVWKTNDIELLFCSFLLRLNACFSVIILAP